MILIVDKKYLVSYCGGAAPAHLAISEPANIVFLLVLQNQLAGMTSN